MCAAPGTFLWLGILLITTVILRSVPPDAVHDILERQSTNLHYLARSPGRVLIGSALWIGGKGWLSYAVIYNIFHVPAERWLGTRRWLAVVAIAHVGATYLSEGLLYWGIRHGYAPESARYTLDYGVSYALAGVQGALTYLIAAPWRYGYLAAFVLLYAIPLARTPDFTNVGHMSALLLGLACYPLTRARPATWDPAVALRKAIERARSRVGR